MNKLNIHSLLTDYSFVVPEIQREYVWGNKTSKNDYVLRQFLIDLNDKVSKGETNIGFLYSYKSGEEHYLIDGQQRYTTLILLLHYITVKENANSHEDYVSMYRIDKNISAFSYRVRSQTDSFLKNLLMSSAITSKMIKQQKWYKSIYEDDFTIHSMMDALDVIDEIWNTLPNLSSQTILNSIFFWYFDVDKTSQGEELYITMNSRGEKLTDSEQIKPRLLNKISDVIEKESFGKKWDNWEEFFFRDKIRNGKPIEKIDSAMNNLIRLVLEIITLKEHSRINPIEDANLIELEDIERYMNAIISLSELSDGKYCEEIMRLYGDSEKDGNYCVLKALLTEVLKGQTNSDEFERVYQTISNHVTRNKIKNLDFLQFLKDYIDYSGTFYDFILTSNAEVANKVFNGHELEKIAICSELNDVDKEKALWTEQSSDFWKGEMKSLITWSKINGYFSFERFERIRANFHKLFKNKFDREDWTSDKVRQALIASRLPNYPINGRFGHYRDEWKEIFIQNSDNICSFIMQFDNVSSEDVPKTLDSIRKEYIESPENPWAEFVVFDYFLGYCNTKHLSWTDECGWILVKNSWAKPFSVRNMRLFHDLKKSFGDNINGWNMWKYKSWNSCVCIQNDNQQIYTDIRYVRKDNDTYNLNVYLSKRKVLPENYDELKESLLSFIPNDIKMKWNDEKGMYVWEPNSIDELHHFITTLTSSNDKSISN
jgi:hypothetical protein